MILYSTSSRLVYCTVVSEANQCVCAETHLGGGAVLAMTVEANARPMVANTKTKALTSTEA